MLLTGAAAKARTLLPVFQRKSSALMARRASFFGGDRHVPPALSAAVGRRQLSGGRFQVTGLKLSDIEKARLQVRLPIRAGDTVVSTPNAGAQLVVLPDTVARIQLELVRGEQNEVNIPKLSVEFSRALRFKNPASAFEPSNIGFPLLNRTLDSIKDWAADLLVRDIASDDLGDLNVHGVVDKPWFLRDDTVVRRLVNLPDYLLLPFPDLTTINTLLKGLGALTEEGSYELDCSTKPVAIEAHGDGVQLSGPRSSVSARLVGNAEIDEHGLVRLKVDENLAPELRNDLGELDFSGDICLSLVEDYHVEGQGRFRFDGSVRNLTGSFEHPSGIVAPLRIVEPDFVTLSGASDVDVSSNTIAFSDGLFDVRLSDEFIGESVQLGAASVALERGQLTASAKGRFFGRLSALHIENAEIDANLQGFDALFSMDGCRLRIDGMVRAALAMQGVGFDSQTGVVSGLGTVSHGLDPRSKLLRHNDVTLLNRTIDFTFREDGTLAIRPDHSALNSFFAPFAKIGGSPERLTDPIASGPAPVGSEAMQNHIAELCNAPVSTCNSIELLVDGVQSFPRRMEMIRQAEESICMQTLIFKEDETGLETANALIDAASRGVQVNVIIDALGNCETFEHVHKGRPLYEMLRDGGVHLALYNDPRTSGLMDVLDALKQASRLTEVRSPVDLQNPALALQVASSLIKVLQPDGAELDSTARNVLVGLARLGLIKSSEVVGDTLELSTASVVDKGQALFLGKLMAEMNHRWHEKYLVVDGSQAIVGGMNTADEYLKGGSGRKVRTLGAERVAWRDTDMFVEGPVAEKVFSCFANNWHFLRRQKLSAPERARHCSASPGHTRAQIIQHRPRIDGDHHITNFMVENIKSLKPGDKCYIGNAYFLPTGALQGYKEALKSAARRGVDVRILTNSKETSDAPQVNQAAVYCYRELLISGVRIFERSGTRCMHMKTAVFGGNTVAIGSWNADNRSASLNSEDVLVCYGEEIASKVEAMLLEDMKESLAREVHLDGIQFLPYDQEIECAAVSVFSYLL